MTYPHGDYHGMTVMKYLDAHESALKGPDVPTESCLTVAVFTVLMIPVVIGIVVLVMSQ